MRTRVAAILGAVLAVVMAGTSPAMAADPEDLIGGTLTAAPTEVTMTSTSTMPVRIKLVADGPFTLDPSTFTLAPGEMRSAAVTGDPSGRVTALVSAMSDATVGDTNSVALVASFPRPAPWSPPWSLIGGAAVALLAIVLVARRLRRYSFTVTRKEA